MGQERRAKGNSPFPAPHPPTKSSQALPVEAELGQLESGRIISHTRTRTPGRWDAPQLHLFQRMTELDWTVQTQKIKGYFPPFGLKKKSSFSSFLTLPPSLRDWFYLKKLHSAQAFKTAERLEQTSGISMFLTASWQCDCPGPASN